IRALYRRELLDRFSAFAFPKREFTPRGGPHRGGPYRGGGSAKAARAGASDRLRKAASANSRDALAQAVLAGLARHPDQITRHAEALLSLAPSDPQLARAIDALLDRADSLEGAAPATISTAGHQTPTTD